MVWTIYKGVHFLTVSWSSFLGLKNEVACCHSDAISPSELREITFSGTFVWKTISVFIKTTGKLSLWRAEFRRTDWRLGRRTSLKKGHYLIILARPGPGNWRATLRKVRCI